jgi:hypothetical protein
MKIIIENRQYSEWKFVPSSDNHDTASSSSTCMITYISPTTHHLFHEDVFTYDGNLPILLLESPTRIAPYISGVLILDNNQTYGKYSQQNNTKTKKRLYKCIPDNPRLPAFLVPYEIAIGFTKKFANKYVTFRYKEWTTEHKHPIGILVETFGDVHHLPAFCEYRLSCRQLRYSMSGFINEVKRRIPNQEKRTLIESILQTPLYCVKDWTQNSQQNAHRNIIAIDPEGSRDYDDALSAVEWTEYDDQSGGGANKTYYSVGIHIANVFLWLESLQLWDMMTDACSTVYLPDKPRHMLPTILSGDLCALNHRDGKRLALTAILLLDSDANILQVDFENTAIQVSHNYVYESAECLSDETYKLLYKLAKIQNDEVEDSHDVVAHWMMKMNHLCGQKMAVASAGIFRVTRDADPQKNHHHHDDEAIPVGISLQTRRVLRGWLSHSSGEYAIMNTTNDNTRGKMRHEMMEISDYLHITSPIRRLVDLLNQMWFLWEMGIVEKSQCSEMSRRFLQKHMCNLAKINANMRSIKKIQQECELLYLLSENPDMKHADYKGIVVDVARAGEIVVYIESLNKMITVGTDEKIELYSYHYFRVYIFEDEYKIKQKLRWMLTEKIII